MIGDMYVYTETIWYGSKGITDILFMAQVGKIKSPTEKKNCSLCIKREETTTDFSGLNRYSTTWVCQQHPYQKIEGTTKRSS